MRDAKEKAVPGDSGAALFKVWLEVSDFYDIRCFGALGAVNNVKGHILAFGQRLEAAVLDV